MTIDDYIDLAIANQRFKSERELGRALGFKGNPVNHWRSKRAWPADATMLRLAEMASVDPVWALIDLNIWRSPSAAVRNKYAALQRLVERVRSAAAEAKPSPARPAPVAMPHGKPGFRRS